METEEKQAFTDAESIKLIEAFTKGQGNHTREQREEFLAWCVSATVDYAFVELMIQGKVIVREDPENPGTYEFRKPQ